MEGRNGHPAHVIAVLAVLLLAAVADGQVGLNSEMNENSQQISEIQGRLIAAALQRKVSQAKMENEGVQSAPAPAPSMHLGKGRAEAEAEAQPGTPSVKPAFAGTGIPQSSRAAPGPRGAKAASTAFPVMSTDALEHLSDAELFGIFHKGTAEIPSALPDQLGKFTMCNGRTFLNVFTTEGWPNGTLPTGDYNIFNNFIDRFWRGKVMATDPKTNQTRLWNLLLNNSTVDVVAPVTIEKGGRSQDHRDSMIVHYNQSNAVFFRPLEDELRRVGPNIWLGRAWIDNPVKAWQPYAADPLVKPLVDAAYPLENATFMAGLVGAGLEGPASGSTTAGGNYSQLGEPLALLYFALDCADFPVPKLHYTPVIAPASAVINSLTGYDAPFYSLPDLNQFNNTGDADAVDNWTHSFPMSSRGQSDPYILWPYTFEDPNGPLNGYIQLPASWFEPIFGAYWAINNQTAPIVSAVEKGTEPIHFNNVDKNIPGVENVVAKNPLTPLQNSTEAVQANVRSALAPAMDPINAVIASAGENIIVPASEAIKQASVVAAAALAPAINAGLSVVPNIRDVAGVDAPLPSAARAAANVVIADADASPVLTAARTAANTAVKTATVSASEGVPRAGIAPLINSAAINAANSLTGTQG